jgi:low affinity Fe/Cu permease
MLRSKKEKISSYKKFAIKMSDLIGSEWAFLSALMFTIGWLITGPLFDFSDNWQLAFNLTMSIIPFIILFLIQNTQYRDSKMIQVKLDELLRSHKHAHNDILNLDKLSDNQLKKLEEKYKELSKENVEIPEKDF